MKIMPFRVFLNSILKGDISNKSYILYLVALLAFFGTSILISIIIFPLPFSFSDTWISELGDPTKNLPMGYIIFDIGFIFTSIGLVPVFINFIYRLNSFHSIIRWILLVLWIIGTITFGSIGIFHDKIQPIHDILSGISFTSLSIAFFILWIGFFFTIILGKISRNFLFLSLSVGQLAIFWILLFAIPVRNKINFSDFAPWEWVGTLSIILSIILCSFFLPSKAK